MDMIGPALPIFMISCRNGKVAEAVGMVHINNYEG
jgi:hypothetical protein